MALLMLHELEAIWQMAERYYQVQTSGTTASLSYEHNFVESMK